MSLSANIARLTVIQIIARVVSVGFGVYLVYLVLHYLDPGNFGRYSLVSSIIQILATVADFGLYLIATKQISDSTKDQCREFSSVLTFRVVSALGFLLLLIIGAFFSPYDRTVKIGIIATSGMFFGLVMNQLLLSIFQKFHETNKYAFIELGSKALMTSLTFVFIYFRLGVLYLLEALLIATVAQTILLFFFARKYLPFRMNFNLAPLKKVWSESWPLALSVIFTTVYFRGDTLALSWLKPVRDVGIYNAAFRVFETLLGFPILFIGLVLPYLGSTFLSGNLEGFRHYFRKAFDGMIVLTLPLITTLIVLATPIMDFLAGSEYKDSARLLQILMVALLVAYLGILPAHAITIIGKQKLMMYFYFASALISLGIYYFFIPRFGYWAAAWTTVIAQSIIMISSQVIITIKTRALPDFSVFLKCLIAGFISGSVMKLFIYLPFWLNATIGGVVYGLLVVAFRVIKTKEIREFIT